jgi:hypothetical protein
MKDPRADPYCPKCEGWGIVIEEREFEGQLWDFMVDCDCHRSANVHAEWEEYISETLKGIDHLNME